MSLTCLHPKTDRFRKQHNEEKKGKHVGPWGKVTVVGAGENSEREYRGTKELLEETRDIGHVVELYRFNQHRPSYER